MEKTKRKGKIGREWSNKMFKNSSKSCVHFQLKYHNQRGEEVDEDEPFPLSLNNVQLGNGTDNYWSVPLFFFLPSRLFSSASVPIYLHFSFSLFVLFHCPIIILYASLPATYLPTNLPATYLQPTYPPTNLPIYQPIYQSYLPTFLFCFSVCLLFCSHFVIFAIAPRE